MINKLSAVIACFLLFGSGVYAQVGVGTTSPNSTLDVRGSLSTNYRAFTVNATAGADNILVFTGTTAATLTLPDASTCPGRGYCIKNASTTTPVPVVTVATTASQTIDGLSSWTLDDANEVVTVVSNGASWWVSVQGAPNSTGNAWIQGGNSVAATKSFGTVSRFVLPFITANTERMRISSAGNVGIGTSTFNATFPEKFVVNAGTTTSVNAIVGKGTINNYLQLNIQNLSSGANASSDVVATANNGSETTFFVDLGINSSGNTSGVMGAANDAYLYNLGQNFLIGTGTAAKSLIFMTGGTTQSSNERMRITGTGSVGIGTNNPTATLDVSGTYKLGTGGTALTNMIKTSVVVTDATNFDYTASNAVTVTVTGATTNGTVILNPRTALPAGIGIGWARVSAANTVVIGFTNTDTTPKSIGSVTFDVTIIQ